MRTQYQPIQSLDQFIDLYHRPPTEVLPPNGRSNPPRVIKNTIDLAGRYHATPNQDLQGSCDQFVLDELDATVDSQYSTQKEGVQYATQFQRDLQGLEFLASAKLRTNSSKAAQKVFKKIQSGSLDNLPTIAVNLNTMQVERESEATAARIRGPYDAALLALAKQQPIGSTYREFWDDLIKTSTGASLGIAVFGAYTSRSFSQRESYKEGIITMANILGPDKKFPILHGFVIYGD